MEWLMDFWWVLIMAPMILLPGCCPCCVPCEEPEVEVPCCEGALFPRTLTATIGGCSEQDGCDGLIGEEITLTYNESTQQWEGETTVSCDDTNGTPAGDDTFVLELYCDEFDVFNLTGTLDGEEQTAAGYEDCTETSTCDPVELYYLLLIPTSDTNCCLTGENITLVITE